MRDVKVRISEDGAVSLPSEFLEELGLRTGDTVVVNVDDGDIRIRAAVRPLHPAQILAKELEEKYGPIPTVDEFIAARREEAAREQAEFDAWLPTSSTPRR
ncbi:AbrB family looped-hinge helix DNA binding protein [Kaistia hirudinis]|uniref:AbrB family looped-hinge helix DNA binding protein n=1 Tax=Kaistia hirudinis TaxID=1293440 RepID=A0A840AJB9_9HYPH|nr:AbrB/MazE/SpoVT family DNA-binding domain-containing protein [Kaistia hirudinis]MBB3930439.1 AbrB family looped-hinge helix DNA binding protein [Kaistia hirudinis]